MTRWLARILLAAAAARCGFAAPLSSGEEPPAAARIAELRAAIDAGDLERAIRAGESAIASDPRNSEAHDLLGRAYGLKAQESRLIEQVHLARKARAFFAKAVGLDPANVAALADLTTYDLRAPSFLGGGKEKARREAQRVLDLDPSRGHELLGELAEREKDPAGAEAHYRQAMEANSGDSRSRRALAGFLVRRQRYVEARRLWFELRELDPADPNPAYELAGVALAWGEDLSAAAEDLEASLALPERADGPTHAEAHRRLSLLLERLGRRDRARAELEEALRLEPHHADWRKAAARLGR